ncbi:hypothetical protein IPG41_02430 [Candidatus Peregrinibacteria bacterium]|nr:MAG: hypothetical protein IPG41_02430 [Candidatus Peregrinibacteria bacterium]
MVRKFLATALLSLTLSFVQPAMVSAETTSNFNVFDVFSIDEEEDTTTGKSTINGSTTISDNIKDYAKEHTGGNVPMAIIMRAINVLMLLIGTFAFLVIFYSGVLLVTANGDEGKLEKGKGMIVPAILGLVFAFLAYYITVFIQSFFY